jgi:hypothetical protein
VAYDLEGLGAGAGQFSKPKLINPDMKTKNTKYVYFIVNIIDEMVLGKAYHLSHYLFD